LPLKHLERIFRAIADNYNLAPISPHSSFLSNSSPLIPRAAMSE
jgi:hypothetical protein